MQQIESKKTSLRDQITFLTENMKTLQREVDTFKQLLEQKEQAHASLVLSLKQLEETAKALRAEIGTDLLSQLSDTEQRELLSLNETVATLKKQLITASTKRAEVCIRYIACTIV
jgi:predicted  nucleic acid-binding Zn-ribbon protein